jgi:hypothetical protein
MHAFTKRQRKDSTNGSIGEDINIKLGFPWALSRFRKDTTSNIKSPFSITCITQVLLWLARFMSSEIIFGYRIKAVCDSFDYGSSMVFVDREGYIEDYVFTFVGCVVDQPVASFTFLAGHEVISRICI